MQVHYKNVIANLCHQDARSLNDRERKEREREMSPARKRVSIKILVCCLQREDLASKIRKRCEFNCNVVVNYHRTSDFRSKRDDVKIIAESDDSTSYRRLARARGLSTAKGKKKKARKKARRNGSARLFLPARSISRELECHDVDFPLSPNLAPRRAAPRLHAAERDIYLSPDRFGTAIVSFRVSRN